MMNMQNMMRQAQKLQKQMEQSQAELAATEFVGTSAQNLVTATLTGDKKVVKIDFDPAVVDPEAVSYTHLRTGIRIGKVCCADSYC